jgi:hypothetical protein
MPDIEEPCRQTGRPENTGTEGVGGYTNTAIDLAANLPGAITGTLFLRVARHET